MATVGNVVQKMAKHKMLRLTKVKIIKNFNGAS